MTRDAIAVPCDPGRDEGVRLKIERIVEVDVGSQAPVAADRDAVEHRKDWLTEFLDLLPSCGLSSGSPISTVVASDCGRIVHDRIETSDPFDLPFDDFAHGPSRDIGKECMVGNIG